MSVDVKTQAIEIQMRDETARGNTDGVCCRIYPPQAADLWVWFYAQGGGLLGFRACRRFVFIAIFILNKSSKNLHELRATRIQCKIQFMKNVTITVEESALEWARIEAAKRNSSVSRLVGEILAEKMRQEDAYAQAMRGWLGKERQWSSDASAYPGRERTYDRAA